MCSTGALPHECQDGTDGETLRTMTVLTMAPFRESLAVERDYTTDWKRVDV